MRYNAPAAHTFVPLPLAHSRSLCSMSKERMSKERQGKERKGKDVKGKARKGKERKGKERKGKERRGGEGRGGGGGGGGGGEGKGREGKGREGKGRECQIWAVMRNGSARLSALCRTDLLGQIKAVHNPRLRHILSLNLTLYAAKHSMSVSLCLPYSTQERGYVHGNMVHLAHCVFVIVLRKKNMCPT